jgi:hypothetical protein
LDEKRVGKSKWQDEEEEEHHSEQDRVEPYAGIKL